MSGPDWRKFALSGHPLPIMASYEATRRINADSELRSIPIFVVNSYALSGEKQKARAADCDEYVPKPYSLRQRKFVSTCPRVALCAI
jgi:CheY-like chemotaxis protein